MKTQYIVEWKVNNHLFTESYDSMSLAVLKQIQLDSYGIESIMIVRGL